MKVINKLRFQNLIVLLVAILIWTMIYRINFNQSVYRISPILDQKTIILKINNFFNYGMISSTVVSTINWYKKITIIRYGSTRRLFLAVSKEVIILGSISTLLLKVIFSILKLEDISILIGNFCQIVLIAIIVWQL